MSSQSNFKFLALTKQQIEGLLERLFEIIALYNLSKSLNISFEKDSILVEAEKFMKHSLSIDDFSILLLDEAGETLTVWKTKHTNKEKIKDASLRMGEGITGLAAEKGKPILIKDVSKDSRYLRYKVENTDIGSFYSVPLKNKNNKVIGVFNAHRNEIDGFRQTQVDLFDEVALQIAQALEKSIIFQETRKLAITDDLTQLNSRRYFMDALEKEISKSERNHSVFSLIMIDVDHFKSVNDTYGHLAGDDILKKLSSLLKSITRKGDITARFGGEEFIVLLPEANQKHAVSIAEKIRLQVEKHLTLQRKNRSLKKVTISAGVSSFPESGKTNSELLASVDECLYFAKNEGRNKVYSASLDKPPENVEGKRIYERYQVSLRYCKATNLIQFIELNVRTQWKMCIVDNVSKRGFKGCIEFELSEKIKKFRFRVFSSAEVISHDVFCGVVAYKNQVTDGRYSIGVEVVDKHEKWEDLFKKITL